MVILPFWMYSQISYPNQTISNQSKTPDDYHKHILQINQQNANQNFTQQLDSITQYSKDTINGPLYIFSIMKYEYNSEGLLISTTTEYKYSNPSIIMEKWHYAYENGLVVKFNAFQASSAKIPLQRTLTMDYKYDQNGKMIERIDSNFNPFMNSWVPELKEKYHYNTNNLIDTTTVYHYASWSNSLEPACIIVHSYDTQQNLIQKCEYVITYNSNDPLHIFTKSTFIYNAQNQISSRLDSNKASSDDSLFYEFKRSRYTYNSIGKLDTLERSYFGDSTDLLRVIQFYDANNDLDYYDAYYYPQDSSTLFKYLTSTYIKSPTMQNSSIAIHPDISHFKPFEYYDDLFLYRIEKFSSYFHEYQDTLPVLIYHYGPFLPNNIAQSHSVQAIVFPNPAQDYIRLENIETGMLEIYSINGQLVNTVELRGDNKINISDLKSGIYFYKINNNEGVITGRFVKL
jgi:hypothetical protein